MFLTTYYFHKNNSIIDAATGSKEASENNDNDDNNNNINKNKNKTKECSIKDTRNKAAERKGT